MESGIPRFNDLRRFSNRDPDSKCLGSTAGCLSSWGAIGIQCFQPSHPWLSSVVVASRDPWSFRILVLEQSVFLEFEVSSSVCAATSRMLRSCSTIE